MTPKASVYGGPQKTNVSTITMSSDVPALKPGPKSANAKAAIAGNAIVHGLRSTRTILPTESTEEYQALREQLYADISPVGTLETALVDRILGHLWRAKRIDRAEVAQILLAQNPRTEAFRAEVQRVEGIHPMLSPPAAEELGTPEFQETVSTLQDARLVPESDTIQKYRNTTEASIDAGIKTLLKLQATRTGVQSTFN
jgi:hypothetical protein